MRLGVEVKAKTFDQMLREARLIAEDAVTYFFGPAARDAAHLVAEEVKKAACAGKASVFERSDAPGLRWIGVTAFVYEVVRTGAPPRFESAFGRTAMLRQDVWPRVDDQVKYENPGKHARHHLEREERSIKADGALDVQTREKALRDARARHLNNLGERAYPSGDEGDEDPVERAEDASADGFVEVICGTERASFIDWVVKHEGIPEGWKCAVVLDLYCRARGVNTADYWHLVPRRDRGSGQRGRTGWTRRTGAVTLSRAWLRVFELTASEYPDSDLRVAAENALATRQRASDRRRETRKAVGS